MSSSVGVTLVRLEFQQFSVIKDFTNRSVPIRSEAIARPPVKMPPEGNPEGFPVGSLKESNFTVNRSQLNNSKFVSNPNMFRMFRLFFLVTVNLHVIFLMIFNHCN